MGKGRESCGKKGKESHGIKERESLGKKKYVCCSGRAEEGEALKDKVPPSFGISKRIPNPAQGSLSPLSSALELLPSIHICTEKLQKSGDNTPTTKEKPRIYYPAFQVFITQHSRTKILSLKCFFFFSIYQKQTRPPQTPAGFALQQVLKRNQKNNNIHTQELWSREKIPGNHPRKTSSKPRSCCGELRAAQASGHTPCLHLCPSQRICCEVFRDLLSGKGSWRL